MIKFAPFVEYKMDKCYLTDIECLGLVVSQMVKWSDDELDEASDIISAALDMNYSCRFDVDLNQTEYRFGGEGYDHYKYMAVFKFTPDRDHVKMYIYNILTKNQMHLCFVHVFDGDEEMGFVDYMTYKDDPKRLEDDK